ncbi:hypothetical protein JXB27_01505 [Candidatus Woesearchaeota archaeon]|nr:hypothetical protein [Candidatus Woesearchaeota archaeon]
MTTHRYETEIVRATASLRYGLEKLRVFEYKEDKSKHELKQYWKLLGKTKILLNQFKEARDNYRSAISQKQMDILSDYAFNLDREEGRKILPNSLIEKAKRIAKKNLEQRLKTA